MDAGAPAVHPFFLVSVLLVSRLEVIDSGRGRGDRECEESADQTSVSTLLVLLDRDIAINWPPDRSIKALKEMDDRLTKGTFLAPSPPPPPVLNPCFCPQNSLIS